MPRSKVFFTVIIILLVLNASFFLAWYAFGLRNTFRNFIAAKISNAIHAKVSIEDLHFSDRQLTAQGVSIAIPDSSLRLKVERLQIQYNLWRFLFSGLKVKKLVRDIDVYRPDIYISYIKKPKPPKPKKPLLIPDITGYFNSLQIVDGTLDVQIQTPMKVINEGNLDVHEKLSKLNLTVINKKQTSLSLNAFTARNGSIKLSGILDKGRIVNTDAEVAALRPLSITHPDLQNFRTEISMVGSLSQDSINSPYVYNVKTQIWGTQLLFASRYQASIPFLGAETDGKILRAQISRSTIGSSNMEAEVQLDLTGKELRIISSEAKGSIDLAMLLPDLSGLVSFTADASGSIKEPVAQFTASSEMASYRQFGINEFSIEADYEDGLVTYSIPSLYYENHAISLAGNFQPDTMALQSNISTIPNSMDQKPYAIASELDVFVQFLDSYPVINAKIINADVKYDNIGITGISGYVNLVPITQENSYYIDSQLNSTNGYSISVVGDILKQNILLDAEFKDLYPADMLSLPILQTHQPQVSGMLKAILQDGTIYTQTALDLGLEGDVSYQSHLDGVGNYDLKRKEGMIFLSSTGGSLNGQPLDLTLSASMQDNLLYVQGLKINEQLSVSGKLNLRDLESSEVDLAIWGVNSRDLILFYPGLDNMVPEFQTLSLFAKYNQDQNGQIDARLNLGELDLLAVNPLSIELALKGTMAKLDIQGGISDKLQNLLTISGIGSIKPGLNLMLDARFNDLVLENMLLQSPVTGMISGQAGIDWSGIGSQKANMDVSVDMTAKQIVIDDFTITEARIKAMQSSNLLKVDILEIYSNQLFRVSSSGALDYNAIKNEYFEGSNRLNIQVEGQLFTWLDNLTDFILEARGNSSLTCILGVQEEQFMISGGKLDIDDGFLRLKDQTESLTNISIKGTFDNNRIIIERGQVQMGDGKLLFNNMFEADSSEHFILGFLDMGILRVIIEEPGILMNIPLFTTPRSLSNVTLKGRGSRYAIIKGPFDMMSITAEATMSNTDVLFPPNTDNLLKLATSFRGSSSRRNDSEDAPLPFTLDVLITLGDNVRYVTYPTNLRMEPGGYLHLQYDGSVFTVQEANFSSERGTIDIFGTVFQVEKVDVTIIDSQNLMSVEGNFFKRAADGTMISLRATTSPDLSKSFADRLEFTLTSDNPEDRSISHILGRLRYSGQPTSAPGEEGNNGFELQDEALNLISGNLDSSLLTPFFSPVESFIRRKLRLDNFSINAGFIRNLYTQYSTDSSQFADYADMKHLTTDIAQFSSSILLNNLSLSASKYLGRSIFLDYELELQEATDLQKRTRLMVSHGTSVRLMLPKRFRLAYTFKVTPQDEEVSHEIMLQRSFRFWGL